MVAGRRFWSFLVVSVSLACVAPSAHAAPHVDSLSLGDGSGSLLLSLQGGYEIRASGRRELLGWVELTVPLERFEAPRRALVETTEPPASRASFRDLVRARAALGAAIAQGQGATGGKTSPPVVVLRLTPLLARGAVNAALRAGGFFSARRRVESLASRAKSSALLPEMRLRAARTREDELRLSPTTSDPYRYTQAGDTDLLFEARLTWQLNRLVFADEEVDAERLRLKWSDARAALVEHVLAALFAWQKALLQAQDATLLPEQRSAAQLAALEAETTLDVLTGGWFSRHVR
jgi:hypothetical protein